jgi:hypothetical protein
MNERHLDPPEDDEGMDLGDEIDRAYEELRDAALEAQFDQEYWPLTEYEKRIM